MSRISVVVMLLAAEVVIVGMAIYALDGGARFPNTMHHADFTAAAIAPIAAGQTPQVAIDDADSRVDVGVSNDGLVHVRDLTQMRGAIFSTSTYPQLRVTRTPGGVRIERAAQHFSVEVFGFSTEAIQVNVPSGSQIEIARCSGADVNGITGSVNVQSQDGHVTLSDLRGNVDASTDEGYLAATNVHGDRLAMESSDGHLTLADVTVGSLVARTHEGRIEASNLTVAGARPDATLHSDDGPLRVAGTFGPNGSYEMSTDDGWVNLRVPQSSDLAIEASTSDGRIDVDGSSLARDDSAPQTIRLGAGSGTMKLATSDGSIHIYTNGDFQSHGF
jgi:Putative adhesin